jgi:hypothetical protein
MSGQLGHRDPGFTLRTSIHEERASTTEIGYPTMVRGRIEIWKKRISGR